MKEEVQEHATPSQEVPEQVDHHETKPFEEKLIPQAESNSGVRKSSRPRKQSKRVLDSVDCNDIEIFGISLKKKHRKDLKLKTGHKKDILPNGRPFKCSLCESSCINNSPAKAKIKRELQPIVKEKFGKLLQLCVKCAIAVNHTENKGPTPEQRAEFEEEGRIFAQHLVEHLNDSAAARLYCSFYQTTKCGCIQCYITGTPANRRRKSSISGVECATTDTTDIKIEEGSAPTDDKAEQTQRANFLLSLLKESMAKKQAPNAKKSNEKGQLAPDVTANMMKESEKFILENRVKLKELNICERGCQKVLCYSNNFLHKKSIGNQPRLQRTRGRAALGRLHDLPDLHKMRCCEKNCVKVAERNQTKMAHWRLRAQQGQKEMWKVLEEMLTSTESGKNNCFKFISMVTGCCLTTVQKVYADILLSKGATGCASKREHGMRFHWKRQKELEKLNREQTVSSVQEQTQISEAHASATGETCLVPALITSQALTSLPVTNVKDEIKPHHLMTSCEADHSQTKASFQQCGNSAKEREDIKIKLLQICETIKDEQEIANVQQILAQLQRNLKMKQEKESAQQGFTYQVSGSAVSTVTPHSSSTPLTHVANSSQTSSCSSSVMSGMLPHVVQDQHVASNNAPKKSRPFVHIKVQQTTPAEQKTSVTQISQQSSREQSVASTSNTGHDVMHPVQDLTSPKAFATHVAELYATQSEALSSKTISQPLDLSSLSSHPGMGFIEHEATPPVSLPLSIGNNAISPLVVIPHGTVSSITNKGWDHLPQQVDLFQIMGHSGTESSHLSSQTSHILSAYPQPTPLQIQPLSLSSNGNVHVQFQLVSPLVMEQSDLMISLNEQDDRSFIIPKSSTSVSHNNETFHQAVPLTCTSSIGHMDSTISHTSTMQQSTQNNPTPAQTLLPSRNINRKKPVSSFLPQTEHNLPFSDNYLNINHANQDFGTSSMSSEIHEVSKATQNQNIKISFDQVCRTTSSVNDASAHLQTRPLKSQFSHFISSTPSSAVMNFQGIQNIGQEGDMVHHVANSDQYLPSSLLNQTSGNITVGTPCSSGSFVFDALADSPVKDSLSLTSPSMLAVPVVTSSLLCEMLMRSITPSVSSISSPHIRDSVPSSALSTPLTASCQSPVHLQNSGISNSIRSSLLISAVKSSPVSSAYCQSLNFNTHTTPSVMSSHPMVTTGKVEQNNLPVAVTIGHSASLTHSQISVSRLNRLREPPQVGIVHPHISGAKGGSGRTVCSPPSSICNSSNQNNRNAHSSPISSSSLAHANLLGESPLPSSASSSGFLAFDSTNLQANSVQEMTADIPANQSHPQQEHLLLSLLLNSQQAANLTDQINMSQHASQFNLSAILGNSSSQLINAQTLSENVFHGQNTDSSCQSKTGTSEYNTSIQSGTFQGSQSGRSNFLPISMVDQTPVSTDNQNIIIGSTTNQTNAGGTHLFQNVGSNTGQVKLIPIILSNASGSVSVPGLFPQNGQLLLNMSPCSGLSSVASLSPQTLNRDNSILLNMSPNSGQNIQQSLIQVLGSTQNTSVLPLPLPSIQNIHQSMGATSASKDQTRTLQVNVVPFINTQTLSQSKSQVNSNLSDATGNESQPTNNVDSCLSTYTSSGSIEPATATVQAYKHFNKQSFSESYFPGTSTSQNIPGKATQNLQISGEISGIAPNTISSPNVAKSRSTIEAKHKTVEVAEVYSSSISKSAQAFKNENSDLAQIENSQSENFVVFPDNQTEGRQVSLIQSLHPSTQSALLQHQLPFQVLSMVRTEQEHTGTDRAVSTDIGTNLVLGQPAYQNIGLSQQLQPVLSISSPNQIFLPVQSIPFNRHLGSNQTMSSTTHGLQLGQQLSDLNTIFLNQSGSVTPRDANSIVTLVEVNKNVSLPCMSTPEQTPIASTGSQYSNTVVNSATNTSKHRPIRPKLLPVPSTAPKISLMLLPDKPGYPAYQVTQLDQTVVSFQQTPEPKEKTLPQVQIVSQQPQSSTLVPGTCLQPQNSLVVSGTSQHQRAPRSTINTAIMAQLQADQQPNMPAQILLFSQPHTAQGIEDTEKHYISNHQIETLHFPSQQPNGTTSTQALPVLNQGYQDITQQTSNSEMQPHQSVAMQPSLSKMTPVSYETPETALLQSEALKVSSTQTGPFQLICSQNKGYQVGVFQGGPLFVDSIQSDTFQTETLHGFEVCHLQSNACETGILQFGSLEVGMSESIPLQISTSQMNSLPSGPLNAIPVQQAVQSDIQRLNPQVASQLSSKHAPMKTQQQLFEVSNSTGQSHLIVKGSAGSVVQPAHEELKADQPQTVTYPDTILNNVPFSLIGATTSSLAQSKLITENISVVDTAMSKVSHNAIQSSSHVTTSNSFTVQTHNIKESCGIDICANLPSNLPVPTSDVSSHTNQLLQRPLQPSALKVDMKSNPALQDVKPVIEAPVQYLQCKEIIDLTNDSPPMSPSDSSQNIRKLLGLFPMQNDHMQASMLFQELQNQIFSQNHLPNQQSTTVINLPHQNLFQHQPVEIMHQKSDQLKSAWEDFKAPNEVMSENLLPVTSIDAPMTGNPEIQFVSRAISTGDDLSYQGLLSSKILSQQMEEQFNTMIKDVQANYSSSVSASSTDQHLHQHESREKSHEPAAALMSVMADSKLNETTLAKEDDKRLFQTTYGSSTNNSNNLNPGRQSLSVGEARVNRKQLMDLSSSAALGQSRSSSTISLLSEVAPTALSNQSSSSVTTASPVASALTNHKFPIATSSPSVMSTSLATTLPSSSAVRASIGRLALHPLTSSTVAFVRTTNTPTDAVGPPNITIMSPAQVNSSPLLRFHHEGSGATSTVISQAVTSSGSTSLSLMTKPHSSGLLKLANYTKPTSAPIRIQGAQDSRDLTLLLYPDSEGKDKIAGQSSRRFSIENVSQANSIKDAPTSESSFPSLISKSVDSEKKSLEVPPPSKPKPRKRPSTVMDLLKNKEKLQATASAVSSHTGNNAPGPVTFMISGAAGTPNLLVMDSSGSQPRVESNTLNFTVRNLQLLGKLTNHSDKTLTSNVILPCSQTSGFTILQPNLLPTPVSRSSSATSTSENCTSEVVIKQSPVTAIESFPTTSFLESYVSTSNIVGTPKISLAAQTTACVVTKSSPSLGNFMQQKDLCLRDTFNKQMTMSSQSTTSPYVYGNHGTELLIPDMGLFTSAEVSTKVSDTSGESVEVKHKHLQEIIKSETDTQQLQLIGQPQVASSYKGKSATIDFLAQKPQAVLTEFSNGEKLKFKTSKNSANDDRGQEMASLKLQLYEDLQKKQPVQSAGTTKKLLLLTDKSPGREGPNIQSNSSMKSSLQVGQNSGQISTEQKQLSLKSPQLLQLMKYKQPFSPAALDQSPNPDKSHHLKLPSSSISTPLSDDNSLSNSRPSSTTIFHQPRNNLQQRDQLLALKSHLEIPDFQGNRSGSVETNCKNSIIETGTDNRRNLPLQNPLLANILFPSTSGGSHSYVSSASSATSKLLLPSENQAKILVERRNSCEDNPNIREGVTLGCHRPSQLLDEQLSENKNERYLKRTYEGEIKTSVNAKMLANKSPPAYSQARSYEVATKDMTRVNKVIEDIYKFPDEGDEPSPPPVYGGLKSQVVPQKFTFAPRKSTDSSHETGMSNQQKSDSMHHSTLSKPNIKSVANNVQHTSGHSAVLQVSRAYPPSFPEITPSWKGLKRFKESKELDKLSSKFSLKKVQFSDVVTSKSASEYGKCVTVSSHIDDAPDEVPSINYLQDLHVVRGHQELPGMQYPLTSIHYLPGKHQTLADDRQDNQSLSVRHLSVAEQLQAEPREGKLRNCNSSQIQASHTKPETTLVNVKDTNGKASELTHIQREKEGLSSSDFDEEDKFAREVHRVLAYQHGLPVNHRTSATTLVDYEQEPKQRAEENTGLVPVIRYIDDHQSTFQNGLLQENIDISSLVSDKTEAYYLHNIQSALNQAVLMEAFDVSNQSDMAHCKAESSMRDLSKRIQNIHDEAIPYSTGGNHGIHMAERKYFMVDKKDLISSPADGVTGNNDKDSAFDQQSSFNILSTQGYSKLSRQRLNRSQSDQLWLEDSTPSVTKDFRFTGHGLGTTDTSCSSDHFEDARDFSQQNRCDLTSTSNISSIESLERQPSESLLNRHEILETNFELARQMKKGRVQILKDSRSEADEVRKVESPQKLIPYSERKSDVIPSNFLHRDTECQLNKELELRTQSGTVNKLTSPTFFNTLDGRSAEMLSSIESYNYLQREIKGLKGENYYLKQEVAKAEQKEKEQQRQRHISSSDKQKGILTESEKIHYTSPLSISSQSYLVGGDVVILPRKRHASSTTSLGILNCSPLPGSEQFRPEEGFQNKICGVQQILESDISLPESGLRGSISGALYNRNISNIDYSPPENYSRDPLVSSSMSGHSRPSSRLELGIPQYESVRHRYPSSEMKSVSSRGIGDVDSFVPLQEHTRHRNLSSSLGLRVLSDVDLLPYEITQRQRNPSASSLKSSFQESDLPSFEVGVRSRNPSSSSWVRLWDYANDINVVRSRNPSGSSNRRSRPGSSSSDRELPVNMDELPFFAELARTRSRNSSGESLEPTLEAFMEPHQYIQYSSHSGDSYNKRTKL